MTSVFDWKGKSSGILDSFPTVNESERNKKTAERNQADRAKLHPTTINSSKMHPVEQMSLRGEPMKRHPTLGSAARDLETSRGALAWAIKQKVPHKGFMWRYVASFYMPEPSEYYTPNNQYNWEKQNSEKPQLAQFTPDGRFIRHHESVAMAARRMNVSYGSIASAIRNRGHSCGFSWRMVTVEELEKWKRNEPNTEA